jgi:hypothetical protein
MAKEFVRRAIEVRESGFGMVDALQFHPLSPFKSLRQHTELAIEMVSVDLINSPSMDTKPPL